jgi:hypothetical protein
MIGLAHLSNECLVVIFQFLFFNEATRKLRRVC